MLIQYLLANPLVALTSLVIGLFVAIIFQVVKFYSNIRNGLPPGPLPIPVLGNVLLFLKKGDRLPHEVMVDFSKQFGPVFTFWTGHMPQVLITDPKIAREALTKVEFAGRPSFGVLNEALFGKDAVDIVFSDFGREWEVLRKVSHSAVRKFAVSERLPVIIDSKVKNFLREIKEQDRDEPFSPNDYVSFLMMSLLATSAFGRDFSMSDPDFRLLNEANKLQEENGNKVFLISFIPMLKYIFRKEYELLFYTTGLQRDFALRQYKEHVTNYSDEAIRDFTDAMIFAKMEAEAEDSSDSKYLKDANVVNAVLDLFSAGSETTRLTLLWVFLFLAEYQEYQKAVRQEVEDALGADDLPTLEHRPRCNLLQAFVFEVMRMRPIIPLNVPHKTIVDTELAGHKIKKGVSIMISIEACSMDKEIWGDPKVFRPERFLDENGKFLPKPNPYFVPFGGGRRVCLGEKLATANSFLIMAGLLHQTKGKLITFPGGPGSVDLSPATNSDANVRPRPYKISFTPAN